MSLEIQKRRNWRTSRTAGRVQRFFATIGLVLQILYTLFHVCQEAHLDCAAFSVPDSKVSSGVSSIGCDDQDPSGSHEQHSSVEHKIEVPRSQRLAMAVVLALPAAQAVDPEPDAAPSYAYSLCSRAPLHLSGCWQFVYRTALPVRAPSLLS